jgi:hypothetical protein
MIRYGLAANAAYCIPDDSVISESDDNTLISCSQYCQRRDSLYDQKLNDQSVTRLILLPWVYLFDPSSAEMKKSSVHIWPTNKSAAIESFNASMPID